MKVFTDPTEVSSVLDDTYILYRNPHRNKFMLVENKYTGKKEIVRDLGKNLVAAGLGAMFYDLSGRVGSPNVKRVSFGYNPIPSKNDITILELDNHNYIVLDDDVEHNVNVPKYFGQKFANGPVNLTFVDCEHDGGAFVFMVDEVMSGSVILVRIFPSQWFAKNYHIHMIPQ